MRSVVLPALIVVSSFGGTALAQNTLTVEAGKAWVSPDRKAENVALTIGGGKITSVEDAQKLDGTKSATKRSYPNGVLTAGFIDVHRNPLSNDSIGERATSFTPELSAIHAYDPWSTRWKRLLARGVTSAVVAPGNENVGGGQSVFVKSGRPARAADSGSFLKLSLAKEAITRSRKPTSLLGALELVRDGYGSLEGQPGTRLSPAQRALASTIGGARRVAIAARERREILAALEIMKNWQLQGCLLYASRAADCIDQVAADSTPVVLAPIGIDATRKQRALPRLLAKRGVPFAFAGESVDERAMPTLQTSLALAVRDGLEPAKALAAVTTTPALIAGRADRVGSLIVGRDADLVVWSREPWDLRARVLLVVQDGKVAYEAKNNKTEKGNTGQ